MADLFPDCPEATSCTETMRLEIQGSGDDLWFGVVPNLVLRADVPGSLYPEVEIEVVVLQEPL